MLRAVQGLSVGNRESAILQIDKRFANMGPVTSLGPWSGFSFAASLDKFFPIGYNCVIIYHFNRPSR